MRTANQSHQCYNSPRATICSWIEMKRRKVLLVEDESCYIELLQTVLKETVICQFDLRAARTLQQAFAELSAASFDVILLDLTLPDEQGIATYTKTHAAVPATPIVVLTGMDDQE